MKQIAPNSLIAAEFARRVWRVTVPVGEAVEEMLQPGYWCHVAAQLRPGDIIEAVSEDTSLYAEFYVRSARRLEASVSLLRRVELETVTVSDELIAQYAIEFRGAKTKWAVVKGKGNEQAIVKGGFESENQARAYLQDYLKALAA